MSRPKHGNFNLLVDSAIDPGVVGVFGVVHPFCFLGVGFRTSQTLGFVVEGPMETVVERVFLVCELFGQIARIGPD